MKKIVSIILCITLLLSITGCVKSNSEQLESGDAISECSNVSPSISETFVSDDIKFTLTSANEEYFVNEIADITNPFYFELTIEYIGEEDCITVTGGMSLASVNLYDSNGVIVGIANDIPMALKEHTLAKGVASSQIFTFPVTLDRILYEMPEVGEYTAIAYINYNSPDGTKVEREIKFTIFVS